MSDIDLNALVDRLHDYGGQTDMVRDCRKAGAEIDRLRAINAELLAALEAIAEGRGRFSQDPLTHAANTIDDMKELALAAITAAEKG